MISDQQVVIKSAKLIRRMIAKINKVVASCAANALRHKVLFVMFPGANTVLRRKIAFTISPP